MKFLSVLVLICVIHGSLSQITRKRPCPPYSVGEIELDIFNGVWYIHDEVPWNNTDVNCESFGFKRDPFNLTLGGNILGVEVDRPITVSEIQTGIFYMTINEQTKIKVTTVATDVLNFVSLYSCTNTGINESTEYAWTLTRSHKESEYDLQKARDALGRAGLRMEYLKKVNQQNCKN